MNCDYCEYWETLNFRYAYGILSNLDIHIENGELFVMLGNDEAVMRVNYCPMCGRKLGDGDE